MVSQHPDVERVRREKAESAIQKGLGLDWATKTDFDLRHVVAVQICDELLSAGCVDTSVVKGDDGIESAIYASIQAEKRYRASGGRSGPGCSDRIYAGLYARGYLVQ